MKNKVKFSIYSKIITVLVLILFADGVIALLDNTRELPLFCIIMGGATITGLYFCPISIEADQSEIKLHRLLSHPKCFAYNDIQSVDTCYPSAGGLRLCGSGGFFGYWGYFNDIMIGTYLGYYGSRSECILIRLKNGKQYVLGCENAVAMANYIKHQICKPATN